MCSSTACALSDKPAAYIWYKNQEVLYQDWSPWYQELVPSEKADKYSCAIKSHEVLRAPEVTVGQWPLAGVQTSKVILQFFYSELHPATISLSIQSLSLQAALTCPTLKGECVCITNHQWKDPAPSPTLQVQFLHHPQALLSLHWSFYLSFHSSFTLLLSSLLSYQYRHLTSTITGFPLDVKCCNQVFTPSSFLNIRQRKRINVKNTSSNSF